jgi:23S rRNA (cytosine1962-C5)-methyltransferase
MAQVRRPGRRPQRGLPIVRKNTVRLPPDVAHRVRAGHPWVYREALGPRPFMVEPGTPIDCVDDEGEFVGRGLYDSDKGIAVRIFTRRVDAAIDAELVATRVKAAIELRRRFLDMSKLGATRLVNAESDGLPGIVADRYGEYIVVQLFSQAVEGLRDALYNALEAELKPIAIYEPSRCRSRSRYARTGRARGRRGRSQVRRRCHRAAVDRLVRGSARGPPRRAPVGEGQARLESVLVHRRDQRLRTRR